MPACTMCDAEVEDSGVDCHECESPSCAGSGCGFWCADCGDWTCHDCGDDFNAEGDAVCTCCAEGA